MENAARKKIPAKKPLPVGNSGWGAHMLLLGAWSGAAVSASSCIRGMVYSRRGVKTWASRAALDGTGTGGEGADG